MSSFFQQHKSIILTLVVLTILLILRVNWPSLESKSEPIISYSDSNDSNNFAALIFVEVWGEVINPGVYEVTDNILVIDLINLAGGLTDNADVVYAQKNIPFSKKIMPEMKVYIPRISSEFDSTAGMINLNFASRDILISIKGIGEISADKIIAVRPFLTWEEVQEKTELRSDLIEILKDNTTL
jgi:competence protein ComEA